MQLHQHKKSPKRAGVKFCHPNRSSFPTLGAITSPCTQNLITYLYLLNYILIEREKWYERTYKFLRYPIFFQILKMNHNTAISDLKTKQFSIDWFGIKEHSRDSFGSTAQRASHTPCGFVARRKGLPCAVAKSASLLVSTGTALCLARMTCRGGEGTVGGGASESRSTRHLQPSETVPALCSRVRTPPACKSPTENQHKQGRGTSNINYA